MESHSLRDFSGIMDYDSIKYIARHAETWILKKVPLDLPCFKWICDPTFENESKNFPVILLDIGNNNYEVLDGKHRIGMAKAKDKKEILAYVAEINN